MYSVGVLLLLAFCPELIERVEGGQITPIDGLEEFRESLEAPGALYHWLLSLLDNPLTGLLTDILSAQLSELSLVQPGASPRSPHESLAASRRTTLSRTRIPSRQRTTARAILDLEYFSVGASTALPLHWTQQLGSEAGYHLVRLDENDPTVHTLQHMVAETRPNEFGEGFDASARGWMRTGLKSGNRHAQFVRAWRVENASQWRMHQACAERIAADLSRGPPSDALAASKSDPLRAALREGGERLPGNLRPECAECFLLHGCPLATDNGNLGDILQNGLDQAFAGANAGNAFGVGIYFGEDIEKCDQYTRLPANQLKRDKIEGLAPLFRQLYGSPRPEHDDVLYVLVCRAIMGYSIRTAGVDIPMDGQLSKSAPTQPRDPNCPAPGCKSVFHQPRARKKLIGVVNPRTEEQIKPLLHHHSLIAELGARILRFREFVLFNGNQVYPCVTALACLPIGCCLFWMPIF